MEDLFTSSKEVESNMAVTTETRGQFFITKVNEKRESLPYYDEVEKKIKYHPAVFNIIKGNKEWHKNDLFHSFGDEPSVIYSKGSKMWHKNGRLHRDGDLPAVIDANRAKKWYKNDELHRDGDLPAIIYADGRECYYKNGVKYTPKSEEKEDDYFSTFQKKIEDDYLVALYKKIVDNKSLSVDQKQDSIISLAHLSMIINKK